MPESMLKGIERRARMRVPFSVIVHWEPDDREVEYTICRDISMNGIFILTDNLYPVSTHGQLRIEQETSREKLEIQISCTVTRLVGDAMGFKQLGMGLTFDSITPGDSIHLYRIIQYQAGREPDLRLV